ncbi:unnamed protein product [Nippostrongylus brasiliensis]|uniref:Tubulin-specific chaperone D n=1 Tax=Nippostrongylus brasiliensis TaxID=27835 RepID=A0A0N4XDN6_NIPBR|nr:unnamed protein product [Nippostrongylus brasiliensis]
MKDTQQSSGDSQQTQCSEDDDDDVVGCLPRALSAGHREIIETVVQSLPEVIASGKEDVIENDFARYARLLDIYQEQPNLLDCVIPSLLKKFESYVTLPSSASPDKRLDKLSVSALRYIAHLTKVRGFKVIVRLLSHHVSYLDKLLTALEQYNTSVGSDLYERHVLLLWLWIVCKNPFDFRRFDPIDQPGSTANRILSVATSYLKYPKVFIKLVQRLALVVLKPRLAAWRYKRGRRLLEENLKEPKSLGNGVGTPHHSGNCEMGADEICVEEEDDGEHPDEVVEWAIGCVLCALSDDHTMVRWSAAKVVDSILSSNFHRLAGHCSWHGGCLALAELSRRGILLPQSLEKAFSIAQQALFYEEPMGRHAFGSNVRDAACYVLWAFARAYEPDELKCFMCVALFDREVNLRRAASAAFQENVGRQANFPDGIALLTIVDYFVVGNRWRCYNKACLEVVRFPRYSDALVDHLIENKVIHWDEVIREQAASALGLLAPFHADYVLKKLPDLYDGCCSTNPVLQQAVELPWKLRAESEKLKVSGGELTRRALAAFIRCMSSIPIDLDVENIERWLDRLLVLACDNTAAIRTMCVMTKILNLPTLNDTVIRQHTQRAIQHMVQQSVGTIGRVRETACKCIKTLLNSSTTRPFISHIDEMSEIYRNEHDFIQDSIFLSITPLLLHEEYYNDLICGLVISAGGVSEGTTMRASQALMEYQVSISKDIKIINARVPSPVRIKTALNALCSLLGCERSSQTWRAAMQLVVRSLSNPMPVIRRAAAEGLYENVCLTDVDEQILILLSETVWQETSPAGLKSIHESAQSIERMLLTEESVVKTLL